nr:MAG TPA: hypothetical protein [Caudoviricetes sp.]
MLACLVLLLCNLYKYILKKYHKCISLRLGNYIKRCSIKLNLCCIFLSYKQKEKNISH